MFLHVLRLSRRHKMTVTACLKLSMIISYLQTFNRLSMNDRYIKHNNAMRDGTKFNNRSIIDSGSINTELSKKIIIAIWVAVLYSMS